MTHVLSIPWLAGAFLALMPLGLIVESLPGVRATRQSALSTRYRVRWAAVAALLAALASDLCFFLGARSDLDVASLPLPGLHFDFPLSIAVNGLTLVLATLVSFVIVMIAQYSVGYLDGDPQQALFFRLLAFTGGFFLVAMVSGNIGLFAFGIVVMGFSLNRLLKFYSDRPKAIMAAHKKSLFTRTADLCLVSATVLIGQQLGSIQFSAIRHFAGQAGSIPVSLQMAAWLIVAAVILKSAHFPFQGWLIQVMEAPTPVSALMHAGVVYSGAIVALRTSSLLVRVPDALIFLGAAGLATVIIASLVMTTQTSIKSMLAWSTTAQLGFMSLELGLGLFPLALLHLIGHSLYKAHAFLSSGSVTDQLRQVPPGGKKIPSMGSWMAATVLGVFIAGGGAWLFGENPLKNPAWIVLILIVAIAISQILLKGFQFDALVDRITALLIATSMGFVYLILHTLFVLGFTPDLTRSMLTVSGLYLALVGLTALGFLLLSWLQGPGRVLLPRKVQLAMFTHLYNGLYTDYWVEQFSHRFWSERVGVQLPRKNLAVESLQTIARNQDVLGKSGGAQ
ncbi:MAG: proton-conducting transporter transmembrane domain-containing protein [Burkholderiales bacterium]